MRPHPLEKNMDTPNNIGHRPALQAVLAKSGEGLDRAARHIGAATIALRLHDCEAAVEALNKAQAAMLLDAVAGAHVIDLLRQIEGGAS
jgi:hypothetical protein